MANGFTVGGKLGTEKKPLTFLNKQNTKRTIKKWTNQRNWQHRVQRHKRKTKQKKPHHYIYTNTQIM
jgi:hypothetical protein